MLIGNVSSGMGSVITGFKNVFIGIIFGGIFGFVGMLIGVPVFAVIYDIARKLVNKGLSYRQAQE